MKYLSVILTIFFCVAIGYSQQIDKITHRCQTPYQSIYGNALVQASGDIFYSPCPTKKNFFNNNVYLWNSSFINFQSATCLFCLGDLDPEFNGDTYHTITNLTYFLDIEPAVTLNGARSTGIFAFPRVRALTNSVATGIDGSVSSYGNKIGSYTGNLTLKGINGFVYLRSQGETAAYGGYFSAFSGGNSGGTNTTPLYGIYAEAAGGHDGTSPTAIGGKFNVTNPGGGGAGTITEAIAVQALFDGGNPTTTYTSAKGIALQGWGAANGGQYTNSYGIYADTSIDRGVTKKYFIYSLSTSPSLYSGDVYVSDNTKGIILKSPDGTCYRFTVANGGALNAGASVTCP